MLISEWFTSLFQGKTVIESQVRFNNPKFEKTIGVQRAETIADEYITKKTSFFLEDVAGLQQDEYKDEVECVRVIFYNREQECLCERYDTMCDLIYGKRK